MNAALKEGWQPLGAPFVHGSGAAVICCQAMVNFHQLTGAETIAKLRRAAVTAFRRKQQEPLQEQFKAFVNANYAFGVTGASIICPFGGGDLSKMAHIPLL